MIGQDDPVTIRPDNQLKAWGVSIEDLAVMFNLVAQAQREIRQVVADSLNQEVNP